MKNKLMLWVVLLVMVFFTGVPGLGNGSVAAATNAEKIRADFNGDGWADLAIGIPSKDVGEEQGAGAVVVIYGSSYGLDAIGGGGIPPASQFWTQDSPGVLDASEEGDSFGWALAAADFNGDGFSDLAIGARGEDLPNYSNLGAVNVLYGSAQGLVTTGEEMVIPSQHWSLFQFEEIIDGLETLSGNDEQFGSVLAVGDFNHDGFGDLAIGIPNKDFEPADQAGAVLVLYGSNIGLTDRDFQFWHQGPLQGGRETEDHFGAAMTTGDFNGDGYKDLVVGVPDEDVNTSSTTYPDAGAVNVIYGSANGLTSRGNQMWHKNSPGIIDRLSNHQHFGSVLASGDFDGNGFGDLAVGVPSHDDGEGSVSVIFGSSTGLNRAGNDILTQNSLFQRTVETPESEDWFGSALAAGDFNGDGKDDLAIGVPGEDVVPSQQADVVSNAGAVNVVYGSATGFVLRNGTGLRPQIWHQEKLGGILEAGDYFGMSLSASNFGRNRVIYGIPLRVLATADLAVGVPFEDVWNSVSNQMVDAGGAVNVIYGSSAGLSVAVRYPGPGASQIWMQGYDGVPGSAETNDVFGRALY